MLGKVHLNREEGKGPSTQMEVLTLEISMDGPSILNNKRKGKVCIDMLMKVIWCVQCWEPVGVLF